jgi:hypothetical protein
MEKRRNKMAYDPAKDKTFFEQELQSGLRFGVYSYGGGEKKLRFTRPFQTNGRREIGPANNLNKKELEDLIAFLPEIEEALKKGE